MAPEILVVGDVAAQQPLWHNIQDDGYEVVLCMEHELGGRLAQSPLPAAMVLSMDGTDYAAVLHQCRRHPSGASLPVVLLAHAQGPVGSLADLIELGADQVLYSPVDPKLLSQALLALAGPGQASAVQAPRPARRPRSTTGRRRATPPPLRPRADGNSELPSFAASLTTHEASSGASSGSSSGGSPGGFQADSAGLSFTNPEPGSLPLSDFSDSAPSLQELDARGHAADGPESGLDPLDALVEEEQAIERDLAAFRVEDLPRIEGEGQSYDPKDAEADLFGVSAPVSPLDRTSTNFGRAVKNPPAPPDPGVGDPGGHTAEIPREEMPHEGVESAVFDKNPRGELARLARRLEPRGQLGVEGAGHETIRIQSRYGREEELPSEATALGPLSGQREGLLSQIEVPRLLWELCRDRFDGVLDLVSADDTLLRIAWRDGCIRTVKGSELGDTLPASLWRRLLLTKAQYDELCSIPSSAQVPETMVAHLVRRGWLGEDEQAFALSRWIEDTILRWWTVGSGRWKLTPDPDHWLCKEGRSNWDVASVFLPACITQVTPALARVWLGEREYAPVLKGARLEGGLAPQAWLASRFSAAPAVREWLGNADGRSLSELESSIGWSSRYGASSMGLCYAMQVLGLIDLPELSSQKVTRSNALLRERLSARLSLALSGSYFEFLGLSDQASSAQAELASQNLREALQQIEEDPAKLASVQDLVLALKENLQAAQRVLGDEDARAMYLRTRTEDFS